MPGWSAAQAAANDNRPAVPLDQHVNPYGFPHLTEKGQPQNTIENTAYLLAQYGITAAYNQIAKEIEVGIDLRSAGFGVWQA